MNMKAAGHLWIIELDERDEGGTIKTIATFRDLAEAMAAWEKIPDNTRKVYWLCRLNDGVNDPAHCVALETKGG